VFSRLLHRERPKYSEAVIWGNSSSEA